MKVGEAEAEALQVLVAGVFEVVQVHGVVDDALEVALVVAEFQREFKVAWFCWHFFHCPRLVRLEYHRYFVPFYNKEGNPCSKYPSGTAICRNRTCATSPNIGVDCLDFGAGAITFPGSKSRAIPTWERRAKNKKKKSVLGG